MAITVDSWIPVLPTLMIGVGVVVLSAAGFAVAMFGRRPLPQPATTTAGSRPDAVSPSSMTSDPVRRRRRRGDTTVDDNPTGRRGDAATHLQVEVPAQVRIRSAFLLALGVIVAAGITGVIASIAVVGFFTLLG